MVSHICLLVELGPICNSMAASLCLKSCEDHSLLKSYNGGLWKNIYRSGPFKGGASFVDYLCYFCLVFVMRVCLFIDILWSPNGKGLTSWLWFVISNSEVVTFPLVSWVGCGT